MLKASLYSKMLQHSVCGMRSTAKFKEEVVNRKQKAVERAIKIAAISKAATEMARKTMDNGEIPVWELKGNNSYNKMLKNLLNVKKSKIDFVEQVSINKQKAVEHMIKTPADSKAVEAAISKKKAIERALKSAFDSKAAVETARKTVEDREIVSWELEDNAYNKVVPDISSGIKNSDNFEERVSVKKKIYEERYTSFDGNRKEQVTTGKQKAIERALKVAADSETAAEMARKKC